MRKRFSVQYEMDLLPIEDTPIPTKSRDSFVALLAALKEVYINPVINQQVFAILEEHLFGNRSVSVGRPGLHLWQLFVLAQVRLCLDLSYDRLHTMANHNSLLRQLLGIEGRGSSEKISWSYQRIVDNVDLLSDDVVRSLNEVIVQLGHDIFKKKEAAALSLKTDSFVVESNVHFPTDYSLLWDSARKCLDVISYFKKQYPKLESWGKLADWHRSIKNLMRSVGQASRSGGKNKSERLGKAVSAYLAKARRLSKKLSGWLEDFASIQLTDMVMVLELRRFLALLDKHIDLLDRRVLQGEQIAHQEKMFSIFEQYTEWINKGKLHPNVELGKLVAITTDQYHLIVDYQVMDYQKDPQIVPALAQRITARYPVSNWSFDRGFFSKENKQLLQEKITGVVAMPKKGKPNKQEQVEESQSSFKKYKRKHSAVESNINEAEHRGLNRCPDRGYEHFKRYVGLGVCAYNLKKIGSELIRQQKEAAKGPPERKKAA